MGGRKGVRNGFRTFWAGLGGGELIRGSFDARCGPSRTRRRNGCRAWILWLTALASTSDLRALMRTSKAVAQGACGLR